MNCKPGELAWVIDFFRANQPEHGLTGIADARGRIVRVLSHNGAAWTIEEPFFIDFVDGEKRRKWLITGIFDNTLRPIRDPGPDAVDETLTWLPVPKVHGVLL